MRFSARRLLPLIAFALALGMVLTGTLSQARSGPALRPAGSSTSAAAARQASARVAGLSQAVGGIPGIRGGSSYHWYAGRAATGAVIAARPLPTAGASPLGRLHQPDVLVVAPGRLPAGLEASIRRMHGVAAALAVDAGRIQVNGIFVNVLGVNPQEFRPFAAGPTARAASLWQDVAAGGMAISYTMGRQDKLSLTKPVRVAGARTLLLPVAGFGTVGIGGVDAVVSDRVARSLGLPQANAIVVSAPTARLDGLIAKIRKRLPAKASVAALVTQVIVGGTTVTTGAAGSAGLTAQQGAGLTARELATFLAAAKSRVGMPYVWGAAGPGAFDCSGLVQWSMAQAGVTMPRVAADQARTGPLLRLSDLRPGDLLFYHTDPTAPGYISHVAIYLGNGQMLQAPEPGMNVEIVPADFGVGFAGAVRVYPAVAAAVAGNPAG